MGAQVIVLAGPSGSGKSRLAARLEQTHGWPTLRLDDFYRDADAPDLPRITEGANAGMVDWDHADTWSHEDAVATLLTLCREGRAEVPVYSLSESRRIGTQVLDLGGATHFCAEGIFAPAVVAHCQASGVLAAAYCITQHPMVTFWRRLSRDLKERRKAPTVLVRRGLALARAQRRVVRGAVSAGCRVATGHQAYGQLTRREGGRAVAG
ncbi:ATP-binding protein [Nocardioides sp. GY 10113]|uniref:AAA family ATPase n=1 Tax=Nocardioides sp. GY 10113 TaxID=2569761 RepID=UPI0010A897B4|nr:AAA family ATPase [Nocardioides sp. GY 10113]TIC86763.1 ATP-binding protein [Nocardioides sp. GY 10113]